MKYILPLFLLLSSCAYFPSWNKEENKSYSWQARSGGESLPNLKQPLKIEEKDAIIDLRSRLQYESGHLDGAIWYNLEDFEQKNPNSHWLKADLYSEARKLSRYGIDPTTKVILVGNGLAGKGEEGRMAWILSYMGIAKVFIASEKYFHEKRVTQNGRRLESKSPWEPVYQTDYLITRKQLDKKIQEKGSLRVLDVRSEKDYLKSDGPWDAEVDLNILHMPWQSFMNADGRINPNFAKEFAKMNPTKAQWMVISENGISSAFVTMALRAYGIEAANYAGGYADLKNISQKKKAKH